MDARRGSRLRAAHPARPQAPRRHRLHLAPRGRAPLPRADRPRDHLRLPAERGHPALARTSSTPRRSWTTRWRRSRSWWGGDSQGHLHQDRGYGKVVSEVRILAMDISNSSDKDVRFRVSGGEPMAREVASWPILPAGSLVSYKPTSPGPWTVVFSVSGQWIVVESTSASDQIYLLQTGNSLRAEVHGLRTVDAFRPVGRRARIEPSPTEAPLPVGSVRRLYGLLHRPGLSGSTVEEMTESMAESIAWDNDRIRKGS